MTTIWNKNHPARDQGFLSRLHDGDLEPSERAHFETHRAHCNECRRLAAEYERALSLFRSVRSAPPPADMANRVLRNVQSVGRQRPGVGSSFFSVDWRWASAFAAALLALLVAAPALLRQPARQSDAEAPIPVALAERAPRSEAAPSAPAAKEEDAPKLLADVREAPPEASGRRNQAPHVLPAAPPSRSAATEGLAAKPERQRLADQVGAMEERPSNKVAVAQSAAPAPPAAEPARDEAAARADAGALDRTARVVVQEDDGLGSPPQLVAGGDQPALADLRGRSFVIVLDSSGTVNEVREAAKKENAKELKRQKNALSKDKDALAAADPLRRLVFAASDRSRRVLLRVE